MIAFSSFDAIQVGLKRHESIHILPLDPSIINILGPNLLEVGCNDSESSKHVFMTLIIMHMETFGLIAQLIISIPLHAIIANKPSLKSITCFLGGVTFEYEEAL